MAITAMRGGASIVVRDGKGDEEAARCPAVSFVEEKDLAIAVRNMDARRGVPLLRQRLNALDGVPRLPVNWSPPGVLPRIAPS